MEAIGQILQLPCHQLVPNAMQPRQLFDSKRLEELSASIAYHGVIQPLLVRPKEENSWELIAGERRWRAAQMAGLTAVPCLVTQASDEESALQAMVENVQRQDLHYLEQASALAAILRNTSFTQEQLAHQLGQSPSNIANKLRLLRLSPACASFLLEHQLSQRHARALLALEDDNDRMEVLRHVVRHNFNVAQTERYIQRKLFQRQTTPPSARRNYIIKDVRLFLNTVERSMRIMTDAGIQAQYGREDTEDAILLTVRIPK